MTQWEIKAVRSLLINRTGIVVFSEKEVDRIRRMAMDLGLFDVRVSNQASGEIRVYLERNRGKAKS